MDACARRSSSWDSGAEPFVRFLPAATTACTSMRSAFSLVPPYLRTDGSTTGVGGPTWFSEFGFQQTRGFRALKVWMAMKEFGLEGYTAAIEENIALAAYLADRVRSSPDFELTA